MKKIFFLLCVVCSINAGAQITFDTLFWNSQDLRVANTTDLGTKIFINPADSLIIYNNDWSIYRIVKIPSGYQYADLRLLNGNYFPSVSDKLFNSDGSIEFLATKGINTYAFFLSVINEHGDVEYTFPDTVYGSYFEPDADLLIVDNEFKIGYPVYKSDIFGGYNIYKLPGSLPCNQCNYTSGIMQPGGTAANFGLVAYPNPFSNMLSVKYNLPAKQNAQLVLTAADGRELKKLDLQNQSDILMISTADLPKGVIILSLYGSNRHLVSKKMVKIE